LSFRFEDAAQSLDESFSIFNVYVVKAAHVENKIKFTVLKGKIECIANKPFDFSCGKL